MKKHFNWKTVSCLLILIFCFAYVITRLIIKGMYIDAAFTAVIAVLIPLLVSFIRKGE